MDLIFKRDGWEDCNQMDKFLLQQHLLNAQHLINITMENLESSDEAPKIEDVPTMIEEANVLYTQLASSNT